MTDYETQLSRLRAGLDEADAQLCEAFSRRMALVAEIGALKYRAGAQITDTRREDEVVARAESRCPAELGRYVKKMYRELLLFSRAYQRGLAASAKNIALIGMPGVGKSYTARELARITGRRLFDVDAMIAESEDMSIPCIFAEKGEKYFRRAEERETARACAGEFAVIATGGGVLLSEANRAELRRSSRIYLLERRLCDLETDGRPLSQPPGALERLSRERMPAYLEYADAVIDRNRPAAESARVIADEFIRYAKECENGETEFSGEDM